MLRSKFKEGDIVLFECPYDILKGQIFAILDDETKVIIQTQTTKWTVKFEKILEVLKK